MLKTNIKGISKLVNDFIWLMTDALGQEQSIPPEIKQMLLVLQSVRRSPPTEQFYELQSLVDMVVPYLHMEKRQESSNLFTTV